MVARGVSAPGAAGFGEQAPKARSTTHLSTLPVNTTESPQDLLVQLPWEPPLTDQEHRVLVAPFQFRGDSLPDGVRKKDELFSRKRHSGYWDCIVFSSRPTTRTRGTKVSINSPTMPL